MSYALTFFGGFMLFIMILATVTPRPTYSTLDPGVIAAGYIVSGLIFATGVALYVAQNRRRW